MDILTIKNELNSQILDVCQYLLPSGKKSNKEYQVGSVGGEEGKSLSIHLVGKKRGIWQDFATGDGGDIIDLWQKIRHCSIGEAIHQAMDYLGIEQPEHYNIAPKQYVRPQRPTTAIAITGQPMQYLLSRGITVEAMINYKLASDNNNILFPFLKPDGTLCLLKSRPSIDGQPCIPTSADFEKTLFGWQAMPNDNRSVILCEGEIDALSWASYGLPAMSVPLGGGGGAKQDWITTDYDDLLRFEKVYLAMDMDDPGEAAVQEIAKRLGKHRCFRVKLPHKDANDCLKAGITGEQMVKCLSEAESFKPAGLKAPEEYTQSVIESFYPPDDQPPGYSLPFDRFERQLKFRPSELTVWGGATGHGKSQVLSHCVVDWIDQGSKICLASLEMMPAQTLKRMVKQTANLDRPSEKFIGDCINYLATGLYVYDFVGKAGVKSLIEVFNYARIRYGCDQFIIDSLMRLGIASDDYRAQEEAVYQLTNWAVSNEVHLHLVCHTRKSGGQAKGFEQVPDVDEVKGASEITSNASNVVLVWRNKKLEEKLAKSDLDDLEREKLEDSPGVMLNICKQRNGDWTGKAGLWFDLQSYRYRDTSKKDIAGGKRYANS